VSDKGIEFIQGYQSKTSVQKGGFWAWLTGPKYGLITAVLLFFGMIVIPLYIHFSSLSERTAVQTLQPQEEALLTIIHKYQVQFSAKKLIIGRTGAIFDDPNRKNTDINVAAELFGSENVSSEQLQEFESLIEGMPENYLRFFPETRLGSPFVVSITEEGIRYLGTRNNR